MSTAKAWGIALLAIIVIGLIGIGGWGFKILTSDIKGQGDSIIQKNTAENRLAAQARIEDMYSGIVAADQKVGIHATALAADPEDRTLQTNFTGIQSVCISAVEDYNAESRKYLSADFRAVDLPAQIDGANPQTDCK